MSAKNSDGFDAGDYPWIPDQGDGNYRNPILMADYSDPDVIRVGNDFYLTASSFNCTPALPILHSRDLVNWSIVGHAMTNLPHERYWHVQPGCGVWAPSIRFHAGKFYIFFPTPDEGIYILSADHPAGAWSQPHLVQEGKGLIDPCPFWDDDGSAYLVHAYAFSRSGIKHCLRVCPMAPDGSRLLGQGRIVYVNPQRNPTIEGPKFHKRNGYYYILAPAGGVSDGWQMALRSRHIFGPYEERILLERGSTSVNGPHQGGLIDSPDGSWWFAHFQERKPYGRIVHLQPVAWHDDWPMMGIHANGNGVGEPASSFRKPFSHSLGRPTPLQISDEFDQPKLNLQWQWQANHHSHWYSLTERPGWLRLFAQSGDPEKLPCVPNVIAQKFPALAFAVQTRIDVSNSGDQHHAGLMVLGRDHTALSVCKNGARRSICLIVNGQRWPIADVSVSTIDLYLQVEHGGRYTFSFAPVSRPLQTIPQSFMATEGHWIGAKIGLFAIDAGNASPGHADIDYFRLLPPRRDAAPSAQVMSETVQSWRADRRRIPLLKTKEE